MKVCAQKREFGNVSTLTKALAQMQAKRHERNENAAGLTEL
jgi:hypothetical protein